VVHSLNAGAGDFIRKPFHPRELTTRIEVVLRRLAWFQEQQRAISAR
jgi:DNA-binding response OmpR family regulator